MSLIIYPKLYHHTSGRMLYIYVGTGFEQFYCWKNGLKPNKPNTINL